MNSLPLMDVRARNPLAHVCWVSALSIPEKFHKSMYMYKKIYVYDYKKGVRV
jgi:hypothetical protein